MKITAGKFSDYLRNPEKDRNILTLYLYNKQDYMAGHNLFSSKNVEH